MKYVFIFAFITMLISCSGSKNDSLTEEDAELVTLLNELDECKLSGDREKCFRLYAQISAEYEKKNLTDLQKLYQQKMLNEAEKIYVKNKVRGSALKAEALQRLSTTYLVEGKVDSALLDAHFAYQLAPKDTINFRAQTLLLLAQIHLMNKDGDSVMHYTNEATHVYPEVAETDLYRITHAYGLSLQERYDEIEELLPDYIAQSNIYSQAELTRLLMYHHEERQQWQSAYECAVNLIDITDSIARGEASENMVRIHALQHERQMEHQRAEHEAERASLFAIIIVALLLLLAASVAGLFYRRKARIAHAKELEAMRLSEAAIANKNEMREENIKLQKLYYEHLYAIILPILNAHRGKSGHINLEEESWELIEENTDMVLPGFTSRLRKQHSALTAEDIRFCCLLMMQVPTTVLANIYGIAPSSVAVRKQRMKKKLDSDVQNQTIENYLNQYII